MKNLWLLLILACTLTACSSTNSTQLNESSLLGEWQLTYILDGAVIEHSPATIIFLKDNMIAGNASCNRMKASYQLDSEKGSFSFGRNASTMMMCPPILMDQESKLLSAMAEVTHAYFKDESLVLVNNKKRIVLQAIKK
ncbi:MAG: META domain-containing protein [Pseudoalteromonas marina]